ncbi:hypothetical protein QBC34DRAFT_444269 [Podospora aff. communis PSN243]|uniref:Secreted protein n=1 Tax=Podospora aff. communis PSN243 TaxID=3040156 RepID=A0AAV9G0X6_9PEZI|nr:hypothetical protein QBC34DRAFT_444269 [Podospora aff. communis PSN243]
MELINILFLFFSGLSLAMPRPVELYPRQAQVVITRGSGSGAGCPAGTRGNIINNGQAVDMILPVFNVSSTGGARTLQCRVSIDMTFPAGCRALAIISRRDVFAKFPSGGSATIDSTYTISSPGGLTDPNPALRLSGGGFAGGSRFIDEDGIAMTSGRIDASRNYIFTDLVSNTVDPGAAPRSGYSHVTNINYRISSQSVCNP